MAPDSDAPGKTSRDLTTFGLTGGRGPFPRLLSFLCGLPHGLASYPQYEQKAAVYRDFLAALPDPRIVDHLPEPLLSMAKNPLLPASWVSEANVAALLLAIGDVGFASDEALLEYWHTANRQLLSGRIYRVMFALASPGLALMGGELRWGQMHRGLALTISRSGMPVTVELKHPPGLTPRLMALGFGTAFQATAEAAGAKSVRFELTEHTPFLSRFIGSWT